MAKALVDGPITHHESRGLIGLGLLALALGVLEAVLIWWRRLVQSATVLDLETALRGDLYDHLQQLPMGFHSRWQSGRLLSRATTDLSAIRRFSGSGLIFLITNILQLTIVTVVLLEIYWPLGLVVATARPRSWSPAGRADSPTCIAPGSTRSPDVAGGGRTSCGRWGHTIRTTSRVRALEGH